MIFNWLFRLLIPYWDDLVINPLTQKASAKSLFAAVGFVVGIALATLEVLVDLYRHQRPDNTAILLLLANGLGLSALKYLSQQANRETATPEGQPLTQPGTFPPEPMPQVPNPNAPSAPTE